MTFIFWDYVEHNDTKFRTVFNCNILILQLLGADDIQ